MEFDYSGFSKEEQIRMENDFLKMKLMLQHGADVGGLENAEELPAEIENQFLNNVLRFESQFADSGQVTVFEKIGKPRQFKPINQVADKDIDQHWDLLRTYMISHGIDLHVCNCEISNKELYRFTIEELFVTKMDDISIEGMVTVFIYDEFHPGENQFD